MFGKADIKSLLLVTALGIGGAGLTAVPAHAELLDYDYNSDGMLSEDEWVDYSFGAIDYDDDNRISETEWSEYQTIWYEPYDYSYGYDFSDFDLDGDGYWEEDEYVEAYDTNIFDTWDLDNDEMIAEDEYDTALSGYEDIDREGLFDW